ncbi:MAG: M23 family metallopeptidase [Tenuifilaceae bacterium]
MASKTINVMIQRILLFLLITSFTWQSSFSQVDKTKDNFIHPITGIVGVTGSFGEIRPDHFHSGVDLRTENRIGKEVKSVNDGFVSRIYVSPNGFGKAIYVDHANGLTSVYAHLDGFYPQADKYIKNYQYQNKTYAADVFPKADELPVKKGDLLGYSGNSGGSYGPHLHYELRTTHDQRIINPVPEYLNLTDSIAPIIRSLHIFRLDSNSYANGFSRKIDIPVSKNHNGYKINQSILASGTIGIGIDAFDKLNYLSTNCGFKSITLTINGKQIYSLILDKFSFAETRYVNSVTDYATRISSGKEIVKLFVDPANYFSGLRNIVNKGRLDIKTDSLYNVDIQIIDASNNMSKLQFTIKGINPPTKNLSSFRSDKNVIFIPCLMDKLIFNDTFTLQLPKNSLYDDLNFTYSFSISPLSKYSPLIHLHNPLTPIHQRVKFSISTNNLPAKYQSKALLATYDNKSKLIAVAGEWKNGRVNSLINTFGDYFIAVDTIAPEIIPINIKSGSVMTNSKSIQFTIKDDFAGIKSIDGYIDNEWVLFEYDKKNDFAEYFFDKERVKKDSNRILKLVITDSKENTSSYSCDFYW